MAKSNAPAVVPQAAPPLTSNAMQQRPPKSPRTLRPWQVWFTACCIPLCVLSFLTAVAGLMVLTDPENTTQLSKSWFGDKWRKLMEYNQFFSMFFLNGGLLGGLIAYTRLKEHYAAKQQLMLSNFKFYNPSELTDPSKPKSKQEPKKRR